MFKKRYIKAEIFAIRIKMEDVYFIVKNRIKAYIILFCFGIKIMFCTNQDEERKLKIEFIQITNNHMKKLRYEIKKLNEKHERMLEELISN